MTQNTALQDVRKEIVRFMRGQYALDEVAAHYAGIHRLRFRHGNRTILSIHFMDDRYDIQLIFGKRERAIFESRRSEFSEAVRAVYDNTETFHDGKWMLFPVADVAAFQDIEPLIHIKKRPNRKMLPTDGAVYGKCGHRCDLCVHYTGITESFREKLIPHLNAVYGTSDWGMRCTGCDTPDCHCRGGDNELCDPLKCLQDKTVATCMACADYPCHQSTVGYDQLEPRNLSADDVTWAILPYVPRQYGR